jgi:hypothetical protein
VPALLLQGHQLGQCHSGEKNLRREKKKSVIWERKRREDKRQKGYTYRRLKGENKCRRGK